MTENIKGKLTLLNRLSKAAKKRYGDNAADALVGALSTVVTKEQLQVLCDAWESDD